MYKQVLYLSILVVAINATHISPRDLVDEALEQLEELKSTIQGEILEAHNNLESLQSDFEIYASQVLESGAIDLQQAQEYIDAQLATVKRLGDAFGIDYSSCLDGREDTLGSLPDTYSLEMSECVGSVDLQSSKITSDATYVIDVTFNKVYALEQQLQSCGTDLLCISPIVNEIQLYKVSIPQSIANEVQTAGDTLNKLQISVQDCSDQSVADYNIRAGSIILEMATCIDRMVS